jgi:hypothetical protein
MSAAKIVATRRRGVPARDAQFGNVIRLLGSDQLECRFLESTTAIIEANLREIDKHPATTCSAATI